MPQTDRYRGGAIGSAPALLPFVLLGLVLALAAFVRMHRIDAQSLWLDEAYTYQRAAMEPAQSIEASIKKSHVPTYFLFMHYWLALGDDELALRLPSAIFGVLTAAAAFVLGRVLGGAWVGLVTALLVALSPLQVRYAQEARMYTMITFAATVALTGVLYLLKHPDQAAVPLWRKAAWRDGPAGRARRASWIAFVAGAVGVLYLHNTGVFFVTTCSLCALVLIAAARGRRWTVIGNWTLANLAVLAVWSFWIGTLLRQTQKVAREFWPDFPTERMIAATFRDLYSYGLVKPAWVQFFFGALVVLGLFALRRQFRLAAGLFVLGFAPPALVLLVSLLKPMFLTRIMLWAPVPAFALMAAGVFALPLRPAPYLLIAAVLFAGRQGLDRFYRYEPKPPWHEIARALHEQYDRKTRVLSSGSQERTQLGYYWNRKTDPIPAVPITSLHGRNGKRVLKQARGYDTLLIVDYKGGKRYSTKQARAVLAEHATLEAEQTFGRVAILRYDMRKKPKPAKPSKPEPAAEPAPLPGPLTEDALWPGPFPRPGSS